MLLDFKLYRDRDVAYLTQFSSSVPVIKYHIDQTYMSIGQDIDMDICVPEDGVANNHAAVEAIKSAETYRFTVKSREDESLIQLNGDTVTHAELQDGDWLNIGGVEFQFTDDGVNAIKQQVLEKSTPTPAQTPVSQPEPEQLFGNELNHDSDALKLIKELKEEVESISTKDFIESSRFSRRLHI